MDLIQPLNDVMWIGEHLHKASAHSDPVWMQESIFEARVTGRMGVLKKKNLLEE